MAETERRRRRIRHTGRGGQQPPPDPAPAAPPPKPAAPAGRPPAPAPAGRPPAPAPAGRPPAPAPPRPAAPLAETTPVHDPEAAAPTPTADDRETERGLRGLVGAGSSQVNAAAALRARDASRPTDADLAAAERDLVIIRRGWVPRDPLAR